MYVKFENNQQILSGTGLKKKDRLLILEASEIKVQCPQKLAASHLSGTSSYWKGAVFNLSKDVEIITITTWKRQQDETRRSADYDNTHLFNNRNHNQDSCLHLSFTSMCTLMRNVSESENWC